MNDWYIDRSKNFVNPLLVPVISYLVDYYGSLDSSSLIAALTKAGIFKSSDGNPYAALTRFRDHGLITNSNQLGEPAQDYLNGFINMDELIIDLFFKRPVSKKNSPNLKPLFLLCSVFNIMFEVAACNEDIFITAAECYKYLYSCNSVDEISYELIDTIINNRKFLENSTRLLEITTMKRNDLTNISIWFNALKNTSLFIPTDDRNVLKPNVYKKDFFEFVAVNGYRLKETPTDSNTNLYEYYCDRKSGITEIIPGSFKANIVFRDESEIGIVLNYLFGEKKEVDFDFSYYFDGELFGIYHPLRSVAGIVYRKIYLDNKPLGRMIYNNVGRKIKKDF